VFAGIGWELTVSREISFLVASAVREEVKEKEEGEQQKIEVS
jgi:hypothetical protein